MNNCPICNRPVDPKIHKVYCSHCLGFIRHTARKYKEAHPEASDLEAWVMGEDKEWKLLFMRDSSPETMAKYYKVKRGG